MSTKLVQKSTKIDRYDIQILGKLLNDCRMSSRSIGSELSTGGVSVQRRIDKLLQLGVIEDWTLKIEPGALGRDAFIITSTGINKQEMLKQIKLVGEPYFVIPCIGDVIVCGIIVRDEIEQKLEIVGNFMKDFKILSVFKSSEINYNAGITKTDLQIINQLLKNPRFTASQINEKTGISSKTIIRCINKLQDNEAFQFTLRINPKKLVGYILYAIVVWTRKNNRDVLNRLNGQYSNRYVQKPFLTQDQTVIFLYAQDMFEIDDTLHEIERVDGVKRTDLFIPKEVNYTNNWIEDVIDDSKFSKFHLDYQIK